MGLDPHWKIIREAHRGFGGNINDFVLALERVIVTEAWRSYDLPGDGWQEPESFDVFVRQVFDVDTTVIEGMLRKANAKAAADRVLAFMREAMSDVDGHGGSRKVTDANVQVDNVNLNVAGGNDPTYTIRRLKRDHSDLAEKVIAGELSPNAAAIKAGFRHPMINVRADDPTAFIRAGLRRYTRAQLLAALTETGAT